MAKLIYCDRCRKEINSKKDKFTSLIDYELKKIIDEHYWHTNCFVAWFNESKSEGAMRIFNDSMAVTLNKLKPMINSLNAH